ncbi:hypothetical protein KM043_016232 [Ampulex compressa]|nr:hypothetical protein KM043_016232 [Ampulex compressa]
MACPRLYKCFTGRAKSQLNSAEPSVSSEAGYTTGSWMEGRLGTTTMKGRIEHGRGWLTARLAALVPEEGASLQVCLLPRA